MSKFRNIINGETPVLIDFHTDWCGPFKALAPIIKKVKSEFWRSTPNFESRCRQKPKISGKTGYKRSPNPNFI